MRPTFALFFFMLAVPACFPAQGASDDKPYAAQASLLTLTGKVYVLPKEQLESPESVGVFVPENGRALQLRLADASLLPEIQKHHGKALTLQGHLRDEGKTFLVQQFPPPGRPPAHNNREL